VKGFLMSLAAFLRPVLAGLCLSLSPLFGTASAAQEVGACDFRASAAALAAPWDELSRTFANGDVRLALLDTIEPAAAALHLLVLSPPYSEIGDRQCRVVSYRGDMGFASIEFRAMTADYDPARGLIFDMPVGLFDEASGTTRTAFITVVLNQATGQIDVFQHAGG
jgi:hypothetical protein